MLRTVGQLCRQNVRGFPALNGKIKRYHPCTRAKLTFERGTQHVIDRRQLVERYNGRWREINCEQIAMHHPRARFQPEVPNSGRRESETVVVQFDAHGARAKSLRSRNHDAPIASAKIVNSIAWPH